MECGYTFKIILKKQECYIKNAVLGTIYEILVGRIIISDITLLNYIFCFK